ncbi:MAG: D-sedoheptulose 7-phosphate isomerase [Bacteroidales bacterium]|nr:D-sedoheptulose 7-phosphate isomerase [Candidatus Cacconaster merdequi]
MAYEEIIRKQISDSISAKQRLLDDKEMIRRISKAAEICINAYREGHKVMLAGNGGSAADAQHLAGELVNKFYFDRPGLSCIALSTDTSILTAIGNDYGFDRIFARQVEANGNAGDVFIGISTSGNSANIVEALKTCKEKGVHTIGLTGSRKCRMDDLCDIIIKVESEETPRIQECQTLIGHIICNLIEKQLFDAEK